MMVFLPTDESHNSLSRFIAPLSSPPDRHRLHRPHRLRGLVQLGPLRVRQLDLDDTLEPLAPQLARHAAEHIPKTELALEPDGARENALLVEGDGFHHLHR